MVKVLRMVAFSLIFFTTIAATRPVTASNTFAAEPAIHRITLIDGEGKSISHETTARTVGSFLEEQGIELDPYDNLTPHYRRRLEDRLTIRIDRAFYINLVIDDEEAQIRVSPGTTSGEFFDNLQMDTEIVLLFDGDEEEVLDEGVVLAFSTWRSEVETAVEEIPYVKEYVDTPSLSTGVEQVRQEGVVGERRIESEVVYVGNEEYTREILGEYVIEPIPHIVDRGVGGTLWTLGALTDTSLPSFHYARRLTMNASAYTAGIGCTGKGPDHPLYGVTASGRMVEHGIVAVDPSVIPLGTRLYVEGYGFALAADTGSAIRGYKIDLFMHELEDAIQFGRRDITVFVLD